MQPNSRRRVKLVICFSNINLFCFLFKINFYHVSSLSYSAALFIQTDRPRRVREHDRSHQQEPPQVCVAQFLLVGVRMFVLLLYGRLLNLAGVLPQQTVKAYARESA